MTVTNNINKKKGQINTILVSKIEHEIKQSTECENLHGITTDISKRLSVIEQPSASKGNAATIIALVTGRLQCTGPLPVIEERAGGGD